MTQPIRTVRIVAQGPAGAPGVIPRTAWSAEFVPYHASTVLVHDGKIWLALRDNSVEPSVSAPDDWAVWIELGGLLDGVATLDGNGRIPAGQLPAIAITDTFTVASQSAMLALDAQKGDIAIRSDLNRSFVLATNSPITLADWKELLTPTDAVLSVAGLTGAVAGSSLRTALTLGPSDAAQHGSLALGGATIGSHALAVGGSAMLSGLVFATDNTSDIGASGANRPRTAYFGTGVFTPRLTFNAEGAITPFGDGQVRMINNVGTGFTRLMLGPNGTAYPGLQPTGASAGLQVRSADGTTFGSIQGRLTTVANAVTETITPNRTLTLYDASGTAYKVPCVAA